MESKRKIVNGETVVECEFSVNELAIIYNALNRLYCQLDESRANARSIDKQEFYDECCQKVDRLIDKIHNIMF